MPERMGAGPRGALREPVRHWADRNAHTRSALSAGALGGASTATPEAMRESNFHSINTPGTLITSADFR